VASGYGAFKEGFECPVRRHPPYCDVNSQAGQVVAVLQDRTVTCEVPKVFGEVLSAEVRDGFIVAQTTRGKASFHASTGLAGKMPWHAMLKAFQDLCLVDALAGRVGFHITHHRYKGGGNSRLGVAGRILIDGKVVCKGVADPGPGEFSPHALGFALATYLNHTPQSALLGDDSMVRALALLDRRLTDAEVLCPGTLLSTLLSLARISCSA